MFVIIILIMEICKMPTLWLKALNKHSITHTKYIKMEMLSAIKNKNKNMCVCVCVSVCLCVCVITGLTVPLRPELAEIHSDAVIFRDDFEMTEGLRQDLWCVLHCNPFFFWPCILLCLRVFVVCLPLCYLCLLYTVIV